MMQAYWFFVVYVSPVLLVAFCAYLAWRAYTDVRGARDEDAEGAAEDRRCPAGEGRGERKPWETDPEAWKGEG